MPEPLKRDSSAPKSLEIIIKSKDGEEWGSLVAGEKIFSSGSIGFYGGGKLENPESKERYQVSGNIVLVGSKPE